MTNRDDSKEREEYYEQLRQEAYEQECQLHTVAALNEYWDIEKNSAGFLVANCNTGETRLYYTVGALETDFGEKAVKEALEDIGYKYA